MSMKHFPMGHPSDKFHGKHNPVSTVTKVIWSYVSKQDYLPKGENKKGAKSVGCGFFRACAKNSSNKTSFANTFNHQVDYFTRKNIKKFQNPFKDVFQNKNTQTNVINRMINNLRPDLTTQLFNDKRIKIE